MNPQPNDNPFKEDKGPILVLAGPGTGKTYQIARRLQRLTTDQNVDPKEITVITFTNEAAKSMRSKLSEEGKAEYLDPKLQPKNILTMHSLGYRIIENNTSKIGLKKGVKIISSRLLKEAIARDAALRLNYTEADSKTAIADKSKAEKYMSDKSKEILAEYSRILKSCNAIDFDDQIELACKLLEEHPGIRKIYKAQTKKLLVDEYQDINEAQHKLINLLAEGQEEGLFVVGDDDQSIYSFRGGEPGYIRNFDVNYNNAKVYQLQTSRRCLKNILDSAIEVVKKHDLSRSTKVNPTYLAQELGEVIVRNCPSDTREAELIAEIIYAKRANKEAKDFYVLVPNRNYASMVSKALENKGIEHENGTGQLENKEWEQLKVLRAWLGDPTSNLLNRHVIELLIEAGRVKIPTSRARAATKKDERKECNKLISSLWDGGDILGELKKRGGNSKLLQLNNAINDLQQVKSNADSAGLVRCLRDYLGVWTDIEKMLNSLQSISELSESSTHTKSEVRILTIQASKGLEADCVFMIALEEGTLPKNVNDVTSTAEQARLVFVGMTRAKKELHISHVRRRNGAASYSPSPRLINPSCFISSFPATQHEKIYLRPNK